MRKQSNRNIDKQTLSLLNSVQSIVHDQKNSMIDKIWVDLVYTYSFLNTDNENAVAIESSEQCNDGCLQPSIDQSSSKRFEDTFNKDLKKLENIFYDKKRNVEFYKFFKAIQLSQSFVLIIDQNGFIEYANPHFQSVSGYTQDELIGNNLRHLISNLASHEDYQGLLDAMNAGQNWSGELVNCKKNGEWYIFNVKTSPINSNNRRLKEYIVVGHDITSFRETEIKLEQAIKDKTILVSELHNRVKNNLAVVSSLMHMQTSDEENDDVKKKLQTIAGRVKTIANIHDILFDFTSFNSLDFSKNIPKIVDSVSQLYPNHNSNINITYDIEPLILDVNQAHPCALLVNEIIANSYKRSITNDQNDLQIDISLSIHGNQVMIDIVSENKKWKDISELNEETLSSKLIDSLTCQLKGTCSYLVNDDSTSFTLIFEKENRTGTGDTRLI